MKKIGVLGGMGPEATILLQRRLLEAVIASDDADHIPLLIDMNPQVPSRLTWILEQKGEDPGPVLASMAKSLQSSGADIIAMPCNTAHHFAAEIEAAVSVPFINMPKLAAAHVAKLVGQNSQIGILASPATKSTGLFEKLFAQHNCQVVYPKNLDGLLEIIRTIKAHGPSDATIASLQAEANALEAAGVDCLVIGCSEFSLLTDSLQSTVPMIDTVNVLVDQLVNLSGANAKQADQDFEPQLARKVLQRSKNL